MKRRTFLSLLGLAPAIPALAKLPVQSAAEATPIASGLVWQPTTWTEFSGAMYLFNNRLWVYDGSQWITCSHFSSEDGWNVYSESNAASSKE